jgi:site-specific recombinase XerD
VSINGVSLYLRTIRAIYNKAIKEKLISREAYPFGRDGFQIQNSPTQKRAISNDNIHLIRNLTVTPNTQIWHAKNYFMFSFFARGMNWVDMAHLKIKDIADGRINYIRRKTIRKTSKSFSIKINPQILEILNYYIQNKTKDDYVFPIIKRPDSMDDTRKDIMNEIKTYNKYLKKIATATGIQANLTSYVSRHSWGSIAKKIGIDINTISDGYGHSDPAVTRVYLDSIENEEIDKANELITL